MFDTHCHLTGDRYKGGIAPVLEEARSAGLTGMLAVAVDVADAAAARDLAQAHSDVWFSAGVHPSEAGRDHAVEDLLAISDHPKCVAWGEMGLDGHWPDPPLAAQRDLFVKQLNQIQSADVAGARPLPVILHSRKAVEEVLDIIAGTTIDAGRFVFHCFTEGPACVEKVLAFGAAVSFTGVVTYRNAADVAAASDLVPLDRLMVETDSPYLTPEPHRGTRPNRPANVIHVARFLASRRGLSDEAFEEATDETARRIFGIG